MHCAFSTHRTGSLEQYAKQLLWHRNPYTQLRYVDDPAIALVEIINENGLVQTWMAGGIDTVPEVFARTLAPMERLDRRPLPDRGRAARSLGGAATNRRETRCSAMPASRMD